MTKAPVRSALPLLLATGALVAGGCGDDDQDKGGDSAAPAAEAQASDAPRVRGTGYSFVKPKGYADSKEAGDGDVDVSISETNAKEVTTNLLVVINKNSRPASSDEIEDELRDEIESLRRTSDIEEAPAPEFDGEEAGALDYTIKEGGEKLRGRIVGVVHDRRAYIVTLTTTPGVFSQGTKTLEDVASSWTWSGS